MAGRAEASASGNPGFSFVIAGDQNLKTDPDTGITRPAKPRTIHFVMEAERIKRVGPDMAPIPISHLAESQPKNAKATKGKHK